MKSSDHLSGVIPAVAVGIALLCAVRADDSPSRRYPGTPIEELRRLAANKDRDAIFRLGERKDTASLPLLVKYAKPVFETNVQKLPESLRSFRIGQSRRDEVSLSLEARRALAQIGGRPDISDYLRCLEDTKAPERSTCIGHLGYIGDRRAVKPLAEILSDGGLPPHSSHEIVSSYAEMSSKSLAMILPDVQARFARTFPKRPSYLEQWKKWWDNHASYGEGHYDELILPPHKVRDIK